MTVHRAHLRALLGTIAVVVLLAGCASGTESALDDATSSSASTGNVAPSTTTPAPITPEPTPTPPPPPPPPAEPLTDEEIGELFIGSNPDKPFYGIQRGPRALADFAEVTPDSCRPVAQLLTDATEEDSAGTIEWAGSHLDGADDVNFRERITQFVSDEAARQVFEAFAANIEDCLAFTVIDTEWFPDERSGEFEALIAAFPEKPEYLRSNSVIIGTPNANLMVMCIGPRIVTLQALYPSPGLNRRPEELQRFQRLTIQAYEAAAG